MIEKIVAPFFLDSAEREDLLQEGYIGFLEAVRDFEIGRMPFQKFAFFCVRKNIYDLIQYQNRKKRKGKSKMLSLDQDFSAAEASEEKLRLIDQIIYKREMNPEDEVVIKVLVQEIVAQLTPLEKKILKGYLDGKDAKAIAEEEKMATKKVENALHRAKVKIKNYLLQQLKQ